MISPGWSIIQGKKPSGNPGRLALRNSVGITLLAFVLLTPPILGQVGARPLTNVDVVNLVKAGVADSTIIVAIEHSTTNFDKSPAALVDLKSQGVSSAIIDTMLRSETNTPVPAPARTPLGTSPGDALAEGMYYKSPTGLAKLQQLMMSGGGAAHVGKMFVPGLTPQIVWTYRGAEAPVRISERKPTFILKQSPYLTSAPGYSFRDLVLVKFNKKKDHRELQVSSGGNMFTFKAGFSKDKLVEITVTRLSDVTISITPIQDLPPGEYMLTIAALGPSGFDFGITGP